MFILFDKLIGSRFESIDSFIPIAEQSFTLTLRLIFPELIFAFCFWIAGTCIGDAVDDF